MVSCAIKCCRNYSNKKSLKGKGITFHKFPTDIKTKEKWIEAVGKDNWFPGPDTKLCSIHFSDDCFDISKKGRRRLFPICVPTLYIKEEVFSTRVTPYETAEENIEDTPRKKILRVNLLRARKLSAKRQLDLKRERSKSYKLKRKISNMNVLLNELQKKLLILNEEKIVLSSLGLKPQEVMKRMVRNKKNISKLKYSPALRTFALTLNYYSPKAYSYVRRTFNSCLPHPHTLSKWYANINAEPGYTAESFQAIKALVNNASGTVLCNIVFDEMAIRRRLDWDGQKHRGYVDMGIGADSDCTEMAREALVFLVVGINGNWKIPIGYFLVNRVSADQKANLVRHGLRLLHDTGIIVCSMTFDGAPTNIAMAEILGCQLNPDHMRTTFHHPVTNYQIALFIDPCHVLKLLRNAFEAIGTFIDKNDQEIRWHYLTSLNNLQNKEKFHLANKLTSLHVRFKNKIMRVKLAAQLFSKSVAEALYFYKTDLKLNDFYNVDATAYFIKLINDVFDTLNSRNMKQIGYKKPMNPQNYNLVKSLFDNVTEYISNLRVKETNISVLQCRRKTGFLGLLICIKSALFMYHTYMEEKHILLYFPLYKINQDHLELFFFNIRAHGGSNNNPSAKQFCAIYKKHLVHLELRETSSGNCDPLEEVKILTCSSAITRLNMSLTHQETESYNDEDDDDEIPEYLLELSDFGNQIVTYIAGFIVHSLIKKIKCDICISALLSDKNTVEHNLIKFKDKGGLIFPSDDVITLSKRTEIVIRQAWAISGTNLLKAKYTKPVIVSKTLKTLIGVDIFSNISFHIFDNNLLYNHNIDLTRAIIEKYIDIRLYYFSKNVRPDSKRQVYNRSVLPEIKHILNTYLS